MTKNGSVSGGPGPSEIQKKPYQKPGFRYEQVFVTSALSCSKATDQMICMSNPPTKVS
jgi:hypothetical protein